MEHQVRSLAGVLAIVLLAGCGAAPPPVTTSTVPPRKLQIVVTTSPLADFAKVLGGHSVNVYDIVKPGVDPHNYKMTPADVTALAGADLLIKNGAGLDTWFDSMIATADHSGPVVDASVGLTVRHLDGSPKQPGDPHIWHSIVNAKTMVANVRQALETVDATNKDLYEGNERAYDAQLDALSNDIQQEIASVDNPSLVTAHDSLGYFCDEFGLTDVGSVLPRYDPAVLPTNADLVSLVNAVKAKNVKAVFAEYGISAKGVEQVAQAAGVKVVEGSSALYGDSLGPEGSDGATYLGAERHNADVIVNNLR